MILAIDIGNTNITAGFFQANRLVKRFTTPTRQDRYQTFLYTVAGNKVTDVIIASVVPEAALKLVKDLKNTFPKIKPVILGKNFLVPVKNQYKYPKQVGQDRLVNAYAVIQLYGAPAVVVDFGTAITFDVISAKKKYKGGVILPGLQTSLNALSEKTALLPQIIVAKPDGLIGQDTKNSMLSGIVYGFACLTDCLALKLASKLGKKVSIIGTGGHINFIAPYCSCFTSIDPDLTLKGLNLLYQSL
jgi:type III pantothenate kinase